MIKQRRPSYESLLTIPVLNLIASKLLSSRAYTLFRFTMGIKEIIN
jgi:hypothetical protein